MSELENILDDALGDFEAEVKTTGETTADSNKTEEERKLPDFKAFTQVTAAEEEAYLDELTAEFDKTFTSFLDATPDLRNTLDHSEVDASLQSDSAGMEANIARTMEGLFAGAAANSLPTQPDTMEGMVPMLEGLLSKLLSKEILHEPLQELHGLYPAWLEANMDHPKLEVYQKQNLIIKNICDIFNSDNYETERSKIYELLNDMQESGPPPEEIVNKMSQDIPDAMRAPPLPSADQCCVQ